MVVMQSPNLHNTHLDLSSFGFRRQSREDQQVLNLRDQLRGAIGLSIKTYQVSDAKTKQRLKIYALELPDLEENRQIAKSFDLRTINLVPDQMAFFRIMKSPAEFDYKISSEEANQLYKKLFVDSVRPVNFYRHKLKFVDLQELPFISIDSDGVRDEQDQPVYGDYDDVLYVRAKRDHFEVYVGFADITPYFNLTLDDPLIRNASRFGYTLYGSHGHQPMIGDDVEKETSLLEGKTRFAWIVKFQVPLNGPIDLKKVKIFRAKMTNRRQLDFYHDPNQVSDPVLRTNLENIRIVGSFIQNRNNPEFLNKLAYLELSNYQQTNNSQAVRELMTFTRHLMGKYAVSKGLPGIYRIQAFAPTSVQLETWLVKFNSDGYLAKASDLTSPQRLSRLILSMANSNNPKLISHSADFFAYLTGQSVYSTTPAIHGDLKFEPYMDIKGLRKLVGLVNQMIFSAHFDPLHTPTIDRQVVEKICARANSAKSVIDLNSAYLNFLQNRIAPPSHELV